MMWPINIGTEEVGVGRTCQSHRNGARRGIAGSGESDVVSIFLSCVITSDGEVRRRPTASSRRTERSVGRVGLSGVSSEARRMDLSATLGFFTHFANKYLAVFQAAKVAGMADEESSCLPNFPEAVVRCLQSVYASGSRFRSQEDSQRVVCLEGRFKDCAEG